MNKQRVLFLCTHNSARSQMAEGFLRSMAGERFDVASAGTEATRVHPLALLAMAEVGVDLSRHTSKRVETSTGVFRTRHARPGRKTSGETSSGVCATKSGISSPTGSRHDRAIGATEVSRWMW